MNPHELLLAHLKAILDDAQAKEFHDFENNKYPAPKLELVAQLENVIRNAKHGLYDN